jgi:hypothetical protein
MYHGNVLAIRGGPDVSNVQAWTVISIVMKVNRAMHSHVLDMVFVPWEFEELANVFANQSTYTEIAMSAAG